MKPALDNFAICSNDIDAVGQDLFVREKKSAGSPSPDDRKGLNDLLFVPKAHRQGKAQAAGIEAFWKIPRKKKPLPFRRIALPRIGRPHMRAGEKVAIDPLLLHIKMAPIASGKEER